MYRFTTDFPKKKPFVFESYEHDSTSAACEFLKSFRDTTGAFLVDKRVKEDYFSDSFVGKTKLTVAPLFEKYVKSKDEYKEAFFDVKITIEKIDDVKDASKESQNYAKFIDNLNELIEKIEELACQLYTLDVSDHMKEDCYDYLIDSQNGLKRVREKMIYR